uniref:Diacylglycerol kinase n=1 Tax=Soboliphyme baturini TaxID=241478 RepID=A0A183IV78_9BILA
LTGRINVCCQFAGAIVPPDSLKLKHGPWKRQNTVEISEISKPATIEPWNPLFVFANKLSGNGDGDLVLQAFRKVLNPMQVFDFSEVVLNDYICSLRSVPSDCQAVIVAAGGDGTISWILTLIEQVFQPNERKPLLAIVPLGTGNDLSRVLGWGSASAGDIDVKRLILAIKHSKPVSLDRWNVRITLISRFGMKWIQQNFKMNNYLSVGVDALVTLNFHHRRKHLPRVMSGRFINKLLFFTYGTKDVLERACRNLQDFVEVRLDDRLISLSQIEGIVVLNIPFWGAGVRPWQMGSAGEGLMPFPAQAIDDGVLEVFALYSSFHIAQMQVGLSEPLRLGQAKRVELMIKNNTLPMQVDGEPWSHIRLISFNCHGGKTFSGMSAVQRVFLSSDAYLVCLLQATSTEGEEVMGLLVGYTEKDKGYCHIINVIPCLRLDKRKDRVEISSEELSAAMSYTEKLSADLQKRESSLASKLPLTIVGWYHSHPHITVFPSSTDVRTQACYQQLEPMWLGLIFSVYNSDESTGAARIQYIGFQVFLSLL